MKIKPQVALVVALLIFAVGIIVTSAAGLYTTESTKVPATLNVEGYSDTYDPADIRGSYTFSEISTLFGIPLDDLGMAFGLGNDAGSTRVGDLEKIYETTTEEIGTASVRLFVAYYLGLPYESVEEVFLPNTASVILLNMGSLTPEQALYLETHTVAAEE